MYQLADDQRASVGHLETLAGMAAQLTEYGNGDDSESHRRYWLAEFSTPRGSVTFVIYPHARIHRIDPDEIDMTGVVPESVIA